MFFSKKYLTDILSLSNSIVVSLHAEAVSVNLELQSKYRREYIFNEMDISTWKHYVNMMGEYHELDNLLLPDGIMVNVLETNTEEILTKDLLDLYPATKATLYTLGIEYKKLIDKYPEYETLIKGIIYPVTIDDITHSEDGDILNYNKDLLEPQEVSLIGMLEKEIKNYLLRWHIVEYTILDEFYIPAIIAGYTSVIVLKIMNIRLSKIGTEEVYSLLMIEFFKSNLSIHNDVDILNPSVKLWLYKNLKYLIKHTGKEETLNLFIKEVLNKSGLLVKEIIIKNRLPVIENSIDLSKPNYAKLKDNLYYVINADINNIISNVTNELILYREINDIMYGTKDLIMNDERYITKLNNDLSVPNNTLERSKIITIEYANLFNVFPANVMEITLENWINTAFRFSNNIFKKFTDFNTKITYTLNEKDAVLLMIKNMLNLVNKEEVVIDSIMLSNVPSLNYITDNILSRHDLVPETMDALLDNIVQYNGVNITPHIDSIIDFYNTVWIYANDEDNPVLRSDAILLNERIKEPIEIILSDTPKTIDEITDHIPFKYTDNYDYKRSLVDLIELFTDIDVNKADEIDEYLQKFKNMTNKLTSYTIQILPENSYSSIHVAAEDIGILREANIITITDSEFVCLELLDLYIDLEINELDDYIIVNNLDIADVKVDIEVAPLIDLELINEEITSLNVKVNSRVTSLDDYGFVYNLPFSFR